MVRVEHIWAFPTCLYSFSLTECPPDRIEDLFDELEGSPDHNVYIKSLSGKHRDCGLLSLFIRKKCELEKEKAGDEVEKELKVRSNSAA
jgi:hypothetical protein